MEPCTQCNLGLLLGYLDHLCPIVRSARQSNRLLAHLLASRGLPYIQSSSPRGHNSQTHIGFLCSYRLATQACHTLCSFVPRGRLELPLLSEMHFECTASADSTIGASFTQARAFCTAGIQLHALLGICCTCQSSTEESSPVVERYRRYG